MTDAVTRPAGTTGSGDVVADIVADVVAATRRGTTIYGTGRFGAPWGIGIPTGALASVHLVTGGACWLVPDRHAPVLLTRGDVAMLPSGLGHALVDTPGSPVRPLADVIGGPLWRATPANVTIAGDGPTTSLLCGGYLLDDGPRHPLTAVLPPVVIVDAAHARGTGLAAAIDLLSAEVERADPGAPAVVASLFDLLFVYLLRAWLAEQRGSQDGWLRALFDPVVGRALALVHSEPARPWTVTALARAVGVPRATFGRRFTALTGQAPMTYVTSWRMAVAARLLREDRAPLRELARLVGYDSEFSFARAFKRVYGHAPGRYRACAAAPVGC